MVVLASLLPTGCGKGESSLGKVSGKITCQGKPVTAGKVLFVPAKGPGAFGELDSQGNYTLTTRSFGDGAVVGAHRVAIVPLTQGAKIEPGNGADVPSGSAPAPTGPAIPTTYRDVATSGLSAEVRSGTNTFDFSLTP